MTDLTFVPIPADERAWKEFFRFIADLTPDNSKFGDGRDRVHFDPYKHVTRDEAIEAFLVKSPQFADYRQSFDDVLPDLQGFALSEPKWNRYHEAISR